jgi:hypothetical protein
MSGPDRDRPIVPEAEDPYGGENEGGWPEDKPFPMTPEDCQRLLMGYTAPWRGTSNEFFEWHWSGLEMIQGWLRFKR